MYMIAYDEFKQYLQESAFTPTIHALSPMIAGVSGRLLTTCIVSPLELLRTQLMYKSSNLNLWQYLRAEIQSQGVLSLWRGLSPTLWRDLPFSGVYWLIYEQTKQLLAHRSQSLSTQPQSWGDTFAIAFGAGVCAGSVAATVTTPFDVVKTRQQLQMYRKKVCCAAVPSGTLDLLRFIAKEEGMSGLFMGLSARVAKVAPACAIMISSYELGKLAFSGVGDSSRNMEDKRKLISEVVK
jgi:solute carrier family 25 protein 39/40